MILVGKTTPKLINTNQIISLELHKGKVTAFVKGDTDGDVLKVTDLKVKEPWSVIVKTVIETSYINCTDFEAALHVMLTMSKTINPGENTLPFEEELRKIYGKQKRG